MTEHITPAASGQADYPRQHWRKPGGNPHVSLILSAGNGAAEANYAVKGRPKNVPAAECQTVLPNEQLLGKTRQELEAQRTESEDNVEGSE